MLILLGLCGCGGEAELQFPFAGEGTMPQDICTPDPAVAVPCFATTEIDGLEVVRICPEGPFVLGCLEERDGDCSASNAQPAHEVRLTRDYFLMKEEFTLGQLQQVVDQHLDIPKDWLNRPAFNTSWRQALDIADIISQDAGLAPCEEEGFHPINPYECEGWRIPTEAEWAYAARGGEQFRFAGSNDLDEVACHEQTGFSEPQAGCAKEPNGFGLCDMTGNLWEMTWDRTRDFRDEPTIDPFGNPYDREPVQISQHPRRVVRGGSLLSPVTELPLSQRILTVNGSHGYRDLGFRFARSIPCL